MVKQVKHESIVVKQVKKHIHQLRRDEDVHEQRLALLNAKVSELRDKLRKPEQPRSITDTLRRGRRFSDADSAMLASTAASRRITSSSSPVRGASPAILPIDGQRLPPSELEPRSVSDSFRMLVSGVSTARALMGSTK